MLLEIRRASTSKLVSEQHSFPTHLKELGHIPFTNSNCHLIPCLNGDISSTTGQLIALQAFVPGVIRGKLSKLHDNMPAMSPELTRSVLETELHKLGQSLETFEDIDIAKSLLGSASIAQVHRAKLRNSKTEVAIKIQHKGMKELMMSDLANFRLLGEVLQRTELKFDLVSPVQELRRQIRLEFDFENEARAMMAIRKALVTQRGVTVPEMIPGLTSKSLLVMTFVDGTPMTRLGDVMNNRSEKTIKSVGKRILTRLGKSYATMILKDGFFQADCTLMKSTHISSILDSKNEHLAARISNWNAFTFLNRSPRKHSRYEF